MKLPFETRGEKMNTMKRLDVFVSGKVQGVFFRANTKKAACSLNVTGWVRNLPDGRVEAIFEGRQEDVENMLEWIRKGPPLSHVRHLEITEEPFTGELQTFTIKY
jgi:acylphosphatase